MNEMNKKALINPLTLGDPYIVTGILMDIGREGWYEFKPYVLPLINDPDPDPDIRTEALKVVTFDWKDPDYEEVVKNAIFQDVNPLNRELALSYWATYYKGTANKATLSTLARMIVDQSNPIQLRARAVHQFFRVRYTLVYSGGYTEDLGDALYSAADEADFEALIPIKEIQKYL